MLDHVSVYINVYIYTCVENGTVGQPIALINLLLALFSLPPCVVGDNFDSWCDRGLTGGALTMFVSFPRGWGPHKLVFIQADPIYTGACRAGN